jgi:uncharacterized protein
MIDPVEKSTEVPRDGAGSLPCARAEVAPDLILDGRLGLFHRRQGWLAVADLHFGYEVSRRRAGGLWPMWGMETVEERLRALVESYQPATLILVGDIVDSSAAPTEAVAWLSGLADLGAKLVLIEGNHDRGVIRRHFDFIPSHREDGFFFHHGHLDLQPGEIGGGESLFEITGHRHPSFRFRDGAGTSLTLPSFVMETRPDSPMRHAVLPAFSPWAGGGSYQPVGKVRQWACSRQRVFEVG